MLSRQRLLLAILVGLAATGIFWSCDRMEGDVSANQIPVVQFVNVPLDSSRFSYAPTVHWFGYDPDGMITGYQFVDDQSDAAVEAYRAGDAALNAYLANLPPDAWTSTENTQETIYLLTTEGDTAEHVFVVRSVDDRGAYSIPKVRIFFRTNQAPNTPEIKKLAQDRWEVEQEYGSSITLDDTLFIGDEPGITWPGIQFVWKGTDPDSRELNIIPLEFSYLLFNETTGQTLPFPRVLDSAGTDTQWVYDWSDWSDNAQTVLSQRVTHGEMETGSYRFELRVRDDGLTLSDTNAVVRFYAIRPTFDKQLLIVDENKPLAGPEAVRGGLSDSTILAFYYDMLPQAFTLAEAIRPFVDDNRDGQMDIPESFSYDTSAAGNVHWFRNKTLSTSIPLSLIHQYKWVWVIDDDNSSGGATNIDERQRNMGWYMNVGGGVMISGRRIFSGSYNIPNGDVNACTNTYARFFCEYFNLESVRAKQAFSASDQVPGNNVADFGGASTANPTLPDLEVNEGVVCSLRFGSNRFCCLPEVEFFGRSTSQTGYDFSETLYNYNSCTGGLADSVRNLDGEIASSTPTQAIVYPDTLGTPVGARHQRIIEVTRVFNVTRNVSGEVMDLRYNGVSGRWEIVVSTPVGGGQWVDSDVLQLDYTYIPIAINDDKPVASRFIRIEGVVEIDFETGDFEFIGEARYRTAIFTFPLSMIDPTPVAIPAYEMFGPQPPAAAIIATQLLFFNSLDRFRVGRDDS